MFHKVLSNISCSKSQTKFKLSFISIALKWESILLKFIKLIDYFTKPVIDFHLCIEFRWLLSDHLKYEKLGNGFQRVVKYKIFQMIYLKDILKCCLFIILIHLIVNQSTRVSARPSIGQSASKQHLVESSALVPHKASNTTGVGQILPVPNHLSNTNAKLRGRGRRRGLKKKGKRRRGRRFKGWIYLMNRNESKQ